MKSRIQTSLIVLSLLAAPAAFAAPQGGDAPAVASERVEQAPAPAPIVEEVEPTPEEVEPASDEPPAPVASEPTPVASPAPPAAPVVAPEPRHATPAEDASRTPALRLSVAASGIRATDASADWVSDEEFLPRGEFGVGVVLAEGLTVQLDYAAGRTDSYILGNYDAELTWHQVGVRARYRLDLLPIVNPYVTAGGGVTVGRARLFGGTSELSDTAVAAYGDLAAGIEARSRGRVVFGGFQDFGYAFRTAYDFDEATTNDGADAQGEVDLGQIRMSGFQIRLGVFVEFPF